MTNADPNGERPDPGATLSGELGREFELQLKKHPSDQQAQVDRGSDESMDASDPPSACQPGGNEPAPSNDFPASGENDLSKGPHAATSGRVVLTPEEEQPYKVVIDHEDGQLTEQAVATMREGESIIRNERPTPPKRDRLHDHTASNA